MRPSYTWDVKITCKNKCERNRLDLIYLCGPHLPGWQKLTQCHGKIVHLPIFPALVLSCSGLTKCQRVGQEWGTWVGVPVHLFPGAISPFKQSDTGRKPVRHPSVLLIHPSSDSCHYFYTILQNVGILLILTFHAGAVSSLIDYLCSIYWEKTGNRYISGIFLSPT